MKPRSIAALLVAMASPLGLGALAHATEPSGSSDNACVYPDLRETCLSAADCAGNDYATVCVEHTASDPTSRRCEIPCESGAGVSLQPALAECATGETCLEGRATPGRRAFYCQPSRFRVDLNLLDQCVTYHLQGRQPTFSDNACSLEANLTSLLDQNGDSTFNIFDLDLCVLAFLEQPGCDPVTASCDADDLVPCGADADCGAGLYCDPARHSCQRDCGVIAAREPGFSELDRQCSGNGKVCDLDRGRCVDIDVTLATCDIDQDCPAGAYCFLGRCAPQCYRSVDCPSSGWFCTPNNRCRALPHPEADGGFVFDPQGYAIRFARDQLRVDPVGATDRSALVILDLITKKVVVGNPSVTFGYRLELSYNLKQDSRCLKPFVDCADPNQRGSSESEAQCRDRQDDCYIDDTEQWLTLASPFGTVSALGGEGLGVTLDTAAADALSPGVYTATLRAIFDNGDSDAIRVSYTKTSPSGEYDGQLTVYEGDVNSPLNGQQPLSFGMRFKVYEDQPRQWNTLLQEYHLGSGTGDDASFVDITSGVLVHGQLHSATAFAFQAGGSKTANAEIPFVGLYSPGLNRIRMIGIIEIPKDFCISEDGTCDSQDATQLQVKNPFGRTIRRQIELIGPFDASVGRFHGVYREKISGLAADYDVTLEGGFIMDQLLADSSPLAVSTSSILPAGAPRVSFPSNAAVLAAIDAEIATACWKMQLPSSDWTSDAFARGRFSSEAMYDYYMAHDARRRGPATAYSALGRTTIFPSLRQFDASVRDALAALGTGSAANQQAHLNVYDFLSSYILPCDATAASPPPVCVDEDAVYCGLLLHQKAILSGWVDTDQVQGSGTNPVVGELELFCPDTLELAGCPDTATGNPALFTLQEHNRFWSDLTQTLKLEADTARSDAFLVLFRNEVNPFVAGAALSYKADELRTAVRRYDQVLAQIVGPAAAKVMFAWPVRAFREAGNDWLGIMQAVVTDRMDAIAQLVDLERRVFMSTGSTDFAFAQHMMQHEYLVQVYLMTLQRNWQGELFAYRGEAGAVIAHGQTILNQLNPVKTALGVTPNQVFFENSNLTRANWLNYRDRLVGDDGSGGLIAEARDVVGEAVQNLQNALFDLDALESSLYDSKKELSQTLLDICGDPDPFSDGTKTTDPCQELLKQFADGDDWQRARDCKFAAYIKKLGADVTDYYPKGYVQPTDCPADNAFEASIACLDSTGGPAVNACSDVVTTFISNTQWISGDVSGPDLIATPPTCKLTGTQPMLDLNGVKRPCVGGEVGGLLQEQAAIDVERRTVIGSVETLLKLIKGTYDRIAATKSADVALNATLRSLSEDMLIIDTVLATWDTIVGTQKEAAEIPNCLVIAGLAVGTNCAGKGISKAATITLNVLLAAVDLGLSTASATLGMFKDFAAADHDLQVSLNDAIAELSGMVRDVDGLIDQYNILTQQSFNLTAAIDDARKRAQEVVRLYNQDVTFIADHLVGRETGNLFLGQAQVQEATNIFNTMMQQIYRMTVAFNHNYNVPPGQAATLVAKAESLVTLDDAASFVADLMDFETAYCGVSGLDCDYINNTETLRVSLRQTLFPNLRDIVDAHTGQVLTAGQQFHNLITQPPFLKRRVRATQPADQVEIPFSVALQALENTPDGTPRWLIDPLSCNHLIDGRDPTDPTAPDMQDGSASMSGSVAVNILGTNLDDPARVIRYQMVRGASDFIRACQAVSASAELGTAPVVSYPIRKHVIGYAPQHVEGSKSSPASYFSASQPFTACINSDEVQGSLDAGLCWRYFARDRSLAAPDWKLVIPLNLGGANLDSAWIIGDGLRAEEAPVIEDIVVYFRYRSRPIEED